MTSPAEQELRRKEVYDRCTTALAELASLFNERCQLSLIVRDPADRKAAFVVSTDNLAQLEYTVRLLRRERAQARRRARR